MRTQPRSWLALLSGLGFTLEKRRSHKAEKGQA
jgi:transposase